MKNPFSILPENFFNPLAFGMRGHYASLLLTFYGHFLEYTGGVEKKVLLASFEEYFSNQQGGDIIIDDPMDEMEKNEPEYEKNPRGLASRSLRRLIQCGWMSEEILADYQEMITITAYAKPFYEALHFLAEGAGVEYESHVIAIYSSLCSDAVADNGHHAVLNAHNHTRLLIESLKVLSQNIKTHMQSIFDHSTEVKDILHYHYDIYMHEIVDRAYNRLKTSDNLSRYRPIIIRTINGLLADGEWLAKTTEKLSSIKRLSREQSRTILVSMLREIQDDLKGIDPLLKEIDDKNRNYSRASTERIKFKLHNDESIYAKIMKIATALTAGEERHETLRHGMASVSYLSSRSLFNRRKSSPAGAAISLLQQVDTAGLHEAQEEMKKKLRRKLNPAKISAFLDESCAEGAGEASRLVKDMETFIKVVYASLYAESRNFPYRVEWSDEETTVDQFKFKKHRFMVKR